MDCKTCNKCGAKWINGQHYWHTGKVGSELDLAGLVCNNLPSDAVSECANPLRGTEGGDTWEKRLEFITSKTDEFFK